MEIRELIEKIVKEMEEELLEKIAIENRKLAEEFIQILYKMCYGISLIKNDINEKEKASKSDKTKC